jgi:hypothetical protein
MLSNGIAELRGYSTMTEFILYQAPGITIARTDRAGTLVPYGPANHDDGHKNHGWIDLRDHPDLVAQIPEVARSVGLVRLLEAIASPASRIMSSACECHAFHCSDEEDRRSEWKVGGFVVTMFKDADRNAIPENLIELAYRIAERIAPTEAHVIGFEFIVEPLKYFFGRHDCHAVMLKALGYGDTEAEAWTAFDYATSAIAESIESRRRAARHLTPANL